MLAALANIYTALLAALKALTRVLEVAPTFLLCFYENKLDNINDEILSLESAGDPKHRDRLGQLRVKKASVGKLYEALRARFAAADSGDKPANP